METATGFADDGPGGNGNRPAPKPITNEELNARIDARQREMHEMGLNFATSRSQFLNRFMNPERKDIDEECGYPRTPNIPVEMYREMYDREPIATRVVQLMPKECWSVSPLVFEDEGSDEVTDFERAWDDLARSMRGQSWFQDEEGSPIWECLYRADELSGIGHFGIVLLGFDDGKGLHEPVDGVVSLKPTGNAATMPITNADGSQERLQVDVSIPRIVPEELAALTGVVPEGADPTFNVQKVASYQVNASRGATFGMGIGSKSGMGDSSLVGTDAQYVGVQFGPSEYPAAEDAVSKKQRKLTFMQPFDESLVQIVQYEANILNPRFGLPVMYRVTLNDPREQHSGIGLPLATVQVHWSRVIHLADNRGSSKVFGVPRMRPVLNPLLDVRKVRGGSAEMYWQGALPGWSLETHPQLGGDVEVDDEKNRQMMEDYRRGLQRWLSLMGMSAKSLAPQVVDPKGQIECQLEAICVQLGCPVRVFKGSERGELASAQDDESWNDRVKGRHLRYVTPYVIVPFVDRMIAAGVLPVPKKGKTLAHANPKIDPSAAPPKPGGAPGAAAGGSPKPSPSPNPAPAAGGLGVSKPGGQVGPTANDMRPDPGFQDDDGTLEDDRDEDRPNKAGQGTYKTVTKGGYSVQWPDLDSLGKKDKATIFAGVMTGMAAYVAGEVKQILPPMEMYTEFLGLTEEKADAILEAAENLEKDLQDQHQAAADDLNDQSQDDAEKDDQDSDPDDPFGGSPKGDKIQKLPPPGFERKPPPPPPAMGKVGPDGKSIAPAFPPKGGDEPPQIANAIVVNGWVTLTGGQHVFIGGDGKMNFGKSAVRAAQKQASGGKGAKAGKAGKVPTIKMSKGKGPDLRQPAARPGAAKAAAKGFDRVGKAATKQVLDALKGSAIGHLPTSVQEAVNATMVNFATRTPEGNRDWTFSQRLAERVSVARGATPQQAAQLKATLGCVDQMASKAVGGVAVKALGDKLGNKIKAMPIATAGYLAWSLARNPMKVFKAAAGLLGTMAKEKTVGAIKGAAGAAGRAVTAPLRAAGRAAGSVAKKAADALLNAEGTKLTEKSAKVVAKALESHGNSDWYFSLLMAALNHSPGDVRQAVAMANEAFEKKPTQNSVVRNDFDESQHPRTADGKFGEGGGDHAESGHKERGWAGHLKEYDKANDVKTEADKVKDHADSVQRANDTLRAKDHDPDNPWVSIGADVIRGVHKDSTTIKAEGMVKAVADAKEKLGKKVWDALPDKALGSKGGLVLSKPVVSAIIKGGTAVEHYLEGFHHAGQEAAIKVAKGWGLNDHQVATVGRILGTADAIARNTTNIPVVHEIVHAAEIASGWLGFGIAKVGFYTPVASLAFVAAAGAPLAAMRMIRGAHSAIRAAAGKIGGAMAGPRLATANAEDHVFNDKTANLVAEAVSKCGGSQWFEALVHAALDQTKGDVKRSIELARHAYDDAKGPAHYEDPTDNVDNAKDAGGHGSEKRQAGFPIVPGVQSVKKNKDPMYGGYHVTLDNGDVHDIYHDTQSGTWQHANPKDTNSHFSGMISVGRKDDVLSDLLQRIDRFKPSPKTTNESMVENCPHCGAKLERGDDGNCNQCGKLWPAKGA